MEHFVNNAQTALASDITSSATTLTVASATNFPGSGNFRLSIDSELLLCTAVSGTTFTVTRGVESTTAIAHTTGALVSCVLTAGALATITNTNTNHFTATQTFDGIIFTNSPTMGDVITAADGAGTFSWAAAPPTTDPITAIYPSFAVTGSSDEFSSGSFSGWTAVNSGSHLPTLIQSNNCLSLLHPGGDGGSEMHAWMKSPTITTGSFVECSCRSVGINQNFNMCGVTFANGTTYGSGAQCNWYLSLSESGWRHDAWTGYNSQGSTTLFQYSGGAPTSDQLLRLVYNGSNSFSAYASCDGISWLLISTKTVTLTPTWAGFFVSTYTGTNPCLFTYRYVKFA